MCANHAKTTKPQWTSGPWHVLPRNRKSRAGVPTFDVMSGPGNPENWDCVADRVDGESNARLIAAAPDLAEALRPFAMRGCEGDPNGDRSHRCGGFCCVCRARAALAAAESPEVRA